MNTKSTRFVVLTTGFALFSMFFGSGNLVFPLQVGRDSNGHIWSAALGLLVTGVVVPLLGMLAIMLYRGSYKTFFNEIGCQAGRWFPLLALSLMGPFGVLPRCVTVAQGSFENVLPGVSPTLFTLTACAAIFVLTMGQQRVVSFIGAVLTPVLLLSLGCIFVQGFGGSLPVPEQVHSSSYAAFQQGFFQGYQTMDLLAAFFFSAFVIERIQKQSAALGRPPLVVFAYTSAIGMGLLGVVYCGLVGLGGLHHKILEGVAPQQLLGVIAMETLGPWAGLIVCLCVLLACLTTGIVLALLFAEYLQQEVCRGKMGRPTAMVITLAIAFFVSTLQFSGIAAFIGPVLQLLYPALIVMSLQLTLVKLGYMSQQRWLFPTASAVSLCVQRGLFS